MSFGSKGKTTRNPAIVEPPYTPTAANSSVILAGITGMKPNRVAALNTNFSTGGSGGLARRPGLEKRTMLGGM